MKQKNAKGGLATKSRIVGALLLAATTLSPSLALAHHKVEILGTLGGRFGGALADGADGRHQVCHFHGTGVHRAAHLYQGGAAGVCARV